MWAILLWIAMFMFLVIIHELGHFIAAKKSGVHVHEFWVWIPDSFITTPLINKIIILLWWVVVNAVFAFLAFTTAFYVWTTAISVIPPDSAITSSSYLMPSLSFAKEKNLATVGPSFEQVIVEKITKWAIADQLGVTKWTIIAEVNWMPVSPFTITSALPIEWSFTLWLISSTWEKSEVTWECSWKKCALWVEMIPPEITYNPIKMSLVNSMWAALHEMVAESKMTMNALWTLWKSLVSFNKKEISWSVNNLSGPVMIVAVWKKLFREKWRVWYLAFAWIISLALALFNILPIPALDWWRIVSVLIQAIWKFSPTKYYTIENYINFVVFVLLMAFWLIIMYKDIVLVTS